MKFTRLFKTLLIAVVIGSFVVSGVALAQTNGPSDDAPRYNRTSEPVGPLAGNGVMAQTQDAAAQPFAANRRGPGFQGQGPGSGLESAAEFLGMDVDDLLAQLRDGATLADIAGGQVDELVAVMVAEAQERLAQAVEDGRLTQDQADERLAEVEARITDRVNGLVGDGPTGECDSARRGAGRGGPGGSGFGSGAGQAQGAAA